MERIRIGMVLAALAIFLAGCAQKVNFSEARAYADAPTEKMLLAGNSDNYQEYIEPTDSKFRQAVTEDKMKQGSQLIRSKIGSYMPGSKQIKSAVRQTKDSQKLVIVTYSSKYTGESDDVIVTMVFNDDAQHQVSGIWLNSPRLRK